MRKSQPGSAFCKKHGDAIFGAMLGALTFGPPIKEIEHLCEEQRPCQIALAQRRK